MTRHHRLHVLHDSVGNGQRHMRSANAYSLYWEVGLSALDLSVVISDELLDDLVWSILQLFISFGYDLLNLLQAVHANVLISVGLENFTGDFSTFKALSVDKVTVFSSCAALRTMIVAAGHCTEVAWLNHHIHAHSSLLDCHLVDLSHLSPFLLIYFFVLIDGFVGQIDQHVWRLLSCFHEKTADSFLLV